MIFALTLFSFVQVNIFAEGMLEGLVFGDVIDEINNPEKMVKLKQIVDEQTIKFRNQLSLCEQNLSQAETKENLVVQDLPIIRFVSEINANSYSQPSRFIVKTGGYDYDEQGCDQLKQRLGIPLGNLGRAINTGILNRVGHQTFTNIVRTMCEEQEKLHSCFGRAEDVIRSNSISVYDIDRSSPIEGFDFGDIREYYPNQYQIEQNQNSTSQ